jgi:hypothetical protein
MAILLRIESFANFALMFVFKSMNFSNPHVRNLYWLVFSPCLTTGSEFEHAALWLPNELMDEWKDAHLTWFEELDMYSVPMENFLTTELQSTRLGVYTEKLLHFYFLNAPGFRLLVANEQVPSTGITVSEIDFCVQWKERILHIELAVKFFLETSGKVWVGPNRRDSLAQKWGKMSSLQIPTARQILVERYGDSVESFVILKGYFFRHLDTQNWWCTSVELSRQQLDGARFAFPEKSEWLSAFQGYSGRTLNSHRATDYLTTHFEHSKSSVAAIVLTKKGQQNVFIVHPEWDEEPMP